MEMSDVIVQENLVIVEHAEDVASFVNKLQAETDRCTLSSLKR